MFTIIKTSPHLKQIEMKYSVLHSLHSHGKNYKPINTVMLPPPKTYYCFERRIERNYYLIKLVISCSKLSAVVITRALAWKPRCDIIIRVNSSDKSTFDCSKAPD